MKKQSEKTTTYSNSKHGILPMFISAFIDICDPVFTFDKFMVGIDLVKYLAELPEHETGRIKDNPVNMLKTVLFGFMLFNEINQKIFEKEHVNLSQC